MINNKKETVENIDTLDKVFLNKLIDFIKPDMEYKKYVDWLNVNNNVIIALVSLDAFYELRILKKKGKLNMTSLKEIITNYTET